MCTNAHLEHPFLNLCTSCTSDISRFTVVWDDCMSVMIVSRILMDWPNFMLTSFSSVPQRVSSHDERIVK